MTTDTPPAIVQTDTRLENELLVLQLIDDAQTTFTLAHHGWENDPIVRPFTHSSLTEVGSSLLLNAALRLIPHSAPKVMALKVVLGVEGANVARNVRVMFIVARR